MTTCTEDWHAKLLAIVVEYLEGPPAFTGAPKALRLREAMSKLLADHDLYDVAGDSQVPFVVEGGDVVLGEDLEGEPRPPRAEPATWPVKVEPLGDFRTAEQRGEDAGRSGLWWRCAAGHVSQAAIILYSVAYCDEDGCTLRALSVGSLHESSIR